ncbi:MAG: hypothetical protein D6706_20640 [Chloroflexi bacterium]|nr:MAG: hypothetical protein D6706_20640 [Chloroflexota bacterium]
MIPQSEWKWSGHAGHLCVGRWCRFHLHTQVGRVIVSTVGEYLHPRHSGGSEQAEAEYLKEHGYEEIGYGRKYETMVFMAGKPCDAPGCCCGFPTHNGLEEDSAAYNDARSANEGHMEMCLKWAAKQEIIEWS